MSISVGSVLSWEVQEEDKARCKREDVTGAEGEGLPVIAASI